MKRKHPDNEEIGAMLRSATEAFPPPDGTKKAIRTAMARKLREQPVAQGITKGAWATVRRPAVVAAAACAIVAVGWWLWVQHDPMTSAYAEISRALDKELPGRLRGSDIDERLLEQLQRFYEAYRLEPGQNLKLVPQPFMPERATYVAWKRAQFMVRLPELPVMRAPDSMTFEGSDGILKPYGRYGESFGPVPFHWRVAQVLGIGHARIDGDKELLHRAMPVDLVYRLEAPIEIKAQELEQASREKLGWQIELSFRTVKSPVVVVSGHYEYKPLREYPGVFAKVNTIEIYGSRPRKDVESGGGGGGDFEEFLSRVGRHIGRPVVSGAIMGKPVVSDAITGARKERLNWLCGPRLPYDEVWRLPDEETELVLQHLAEQTGLTFRVEERQVRMLFVESSRPKT